jgi:hypothetical protein
VTNTPDAEVPQVLCRQVRQDRIIDVVLAERSLVLFETEAPGDGILVEFRSVVDAVRCAIEVQNGMVERNAGLPPERRIEFRVGIHLGDVVEESDGDLMGDGVNIAARLEGIAKPGTICLSEDAYRQVKSRVQRPSCSPATRPGASPPTSPPSGSAYEIASNDGPFQLPCFPVNAPGKRGGSTLGSRWMRLCRWAHLRTHPGDRLGPFSRALRRSVSRRQFSRVRDGSVPTAPEIAPCYGGCTETGATWRHRQLCAGMPEE